MALCPHCEKPLLTVRMNPMTGTSPNLSQWNCVAFSCPSCQKVISVDVDITAVRSDILNRLDLIRAGRTP